MNQRLEAVYSFFEEKLPDIYGASEVRLTQIQMAVYLAGFLSSNSKKKTMLVHAPVGTGKTFSVLIPAIYNLNESYQKVIYSTSSLNLQAQLRTEELKTLKDLGAIKDFIIAKGTSHYLCYKKIGHAPVSSKIKEDLKKFALSSIEGDRVEFERKNYPLADNIWSKINLSTQRDCKDCYSGGECPTDNHRRKFNNLTYKVVVTNHNQLIQSVINSLKGFSPIINYISPGGIVIIDEAHDFEDAILSQLSESFRVNELEKSLEHFDPLDREKLLPLIDDFSKELNSLEKRLETNKGRHPIPIKCLDILRTFQKAFGDQLTSDAFRLSQRAPNRFDEVSPLEQISDIVDSILDTSKNAQWLDLENKAIVVVTREFKNQAREIIKNLTRNNKVIFTSGTLAVDNSFDHVFYSWGGPPPACESVILGTVFDYSKQAMVYVPNDVPKPPSTLSTEFWEYCKLLSTRIVELIKITGGRTLVLCTSHKQLENLHQILKPQLKLLGINFLKQGEKSVELLTEDFKTDETSVLIGTGSFFAGLSVKHKSLISVILCRLPFPPREDPFLNLIAENLDSSERMDMVDYPRMLIKLFQAGGRLIRTIEDFGCFTILDPRVCESDYSDKVTMGLNNTGYTITRNLSDVERFINTRMNQSGFAQYPDYSREYIEIPQSLTSHEQTRMGFTTRQTVNPIPSETHITEDQKSFYIDIRIRSGLTPKFVQAIKDPYLLFEHVMDLNLKRNLEISIIDSFPYVSDVQKKYFLAKYKDKKSRKNSSVTVYHLTPEQLEKYKTPGLVSF